MGHGRPDPRDVSKSTDSILMRPDGAVTRRALPSRRGGVALLLRPLRTPWPWASEGEGVLGSRAAFPAGDPRRRLIRKGAFGHELLVGCRDDERVSPANRPLFSGTAIGCSLVSVIDGASLGLRRGRPTQRAIIVSWRWLHVIDFIAPYCFYNGVVGTRPGATMRAPGLVCLAGLKGRPNPP